MPGGVFLLSAKPQTFDLADTCTLVPYPLTHARENKGIGRCLSPGEWKTWVRWRQCSLVYFHLFTQRYLMSTFETVLGSSPRQERPFLWAIPFRGPHSGLLLAAPVAPGQGVGGDKGICPSTSQGHPLPFCQLPHYATF